MGFLSDLINNPVGALTGSTAARRQVDRGTAAANQQLDATLAVAADYLTPYLGPGAAALRRITAGVAPGGAFAQGYTGSFDPAAHAFRPTGLPALGSPDINAALPDAGFQAPVPPFSSMAFDVTADPGYGFRLKEGLDAVERSAAAGGKALSGQTLKALTDYAQGLASQEYANAYDRASAENRQRYDRALGENQLAFDRGVRLSDLLYGRQSDTFDRTLALNDLLYGRQLGENQLAYDRALADDLRNEQRYYADDALRYGRLSDLLRLGYGAAGDLAGLASGTGVRQAGNVFDAGTFGGGTTFAGFGRAYDTGLRLASLLPRP